MLGPGDLNAEIPRQRLVGGDLESYRELVLELLDMSETLVEDDGIIDVVEHVRDCAVSLLSLIKTRINSIQLECSPWRGCACSHVLHVTTSF